MTKLIEWAVLGAALALLLLVAAKLTAPGLLASFAAGGAALGMLICWAVQCRKP
jgi:hypothetical protein